MVIALVAIMVATLLLGFPMMIPMIIAPLAVLMLYIPLMDPMMITQQLIAGVQSFVLLAVPMFIFAADIMCYGQSANRLLDFVEVFVGHRKGGMAITTAAACTLFGSISGSCQATVVAIGKPMRGKLLDAGYHDSDIMALIVNSADLALLIPPSISMLMYAVVTGTSVGDLFIAGIGPGLIILVLYSIYSHLLARKQNIPVIPRKDWKARFNASKRALLTLGFPIVILGGIYSGVFSPTEAAAISVLYAFILEFIIYRSISLKDIKHIALSTGLVTAAVFILVAGGQVFSWVISYARIPQMLTANLLGPDPSALAILAAVTVFFFIGCMFVDSLVVIIILTPIFFPLAMHAGIDPVHLGIIVTLQAAIGAATPPFGCDIFTACAVFNKPYLDVIRRSGMLIALKVAVAVLLIFVPEIALWTLKLIP